MNDGNGNGNGNTKPVFLDSVVGMGGILTSITEDKKLPVGMRKVSGNGSSPLADGSEPSVAARRDVDSDRKSGREVSKTSDTTNNFGLVCTEWWWMDDGQEPPIIMHSESNLDGGYWMCIEWGYDWWPYPTGGGGGSGGGCQATSNIGTPRRMYDSDTTNHNSGVHSAQTEWQTYCNVESNCVQTCEVEAWRKNHEDNGSTGFYWHVGGMSVNRRVGQGTHNSSVSCETAVG